MNKIKVDDSRFKSLNSKILTGFILVAVFTAGIYVLLGGYAVWDMKEYYLRKSCKNEFYSEQFGYEVRDWCDNKKVTLDDLKMGNSYSQNYMGMHTDYSRYFIFIEDIGSIRSPDVKSFEVIERRLLLLSLFISLFLVFIFYKRQRIFVWIKKYNIIFDNSEEKIK